MSLSIERNGAKFIVETFISHGSDDDVKDKLDRLDQPSRRCVQAAFRLLFKCGEEISTIEEKKLKENLNVDLIKTTHNNLTSTENSIENKSSIMDKFSFSYLSTENLFKEMLDCKKELIEMKSRRNKKITKLEKELKKNDKEIDLIRNEISIQKEKLSNLGKIIELKELEKRRDNILNIINLVTNYRDESKNKSNQLLVDKDRLERNLDKGSCNSILQDIAKDSDTSAIKSVLLNKTSTNSLRLLKKELFKSETSYAAINEELNNCTENKSLNDSINKFGLKKVRENISKEIEELSNQKKELESVSSSESLANKNSKKTEEIENKIDTLKSKKEKYRKRRDAFSNIKDAYTAINGVRRPAAEPVFFANRVLADGFEKIDLPALKKEDKELFENLLELKALLNASKKKGAKITREGIGKKIDELLSEAQENCAKIDNMIKNLEIKKEYLSIKGINYFSLKQKNADAQKTEQSATPSQNNLEISKEDCQSIINSYKEIPEISKKNRKIIAEKIEEIVSNYSSSKSEPTMRPFFQELEDLETGLLLDPEEQGGLSAKEANRTLSKNLSKWQKQLKEIKKQEKDFPKELASPKLEEASSSTAMDNAFLSVDFFLIGRFYTNLDIVTEKNRMDVAVKVAKFKSDFKKQKSPSELNNECIVELNNLERGLLRRNESYSLSPKEANLLIVQHQIKWEKKANALLESQKSKELEEIRQESTEDSQDETGSSFSSEFEHIPEGTSGSEEGIIEGTKNLGEEEAEGEEYLSSEGEQEQTAEQKDDSLYGFTHNPNNLPKDAGRSFAKQFMGKGNFMDTITLQENASVFMGQSPTAEDS